ncbi:PREDICTED: VQ motif-containing protein 5-like [Camelina sativa]|uniref:VQ motif-containing protein 5-like n=1 Tax=Camelina sativa TaxID=90675 RepID=A0ABM0VYI6_CAMSA|nr:PREDICTED: VQ motif-containing protein 5-like [Camelina sativa]
MYQQRPRNDYSRVNNMRKSNFDLLHARSNAVHQPPQPQPQTQVYIIDKNDFKSLVQKLTSLESCERLPQNHQKIIPEPINRTSSVPPSSMSAAQEDPDVSLYMRYLQSCLLEESSGSNIIGDQFQQPFDDDKYESHMLVQAPTQSVLQYNGFEPVIIPSSNTFPSSWFNGSPQHMQHDASLLQSTRVDYAQPLNFTFSSMTQPGGFGPDLDCVSLDEIFDVPYEINS